MKELEGDMQTLLDLDEDGYESSNAGETIRDCKEEQRGYDTSKHSGMDVMRFYKRLLERYADALKDDLDKLYTEKNRIEQKYEKKSGNGSLLRL